MQDPYKVLGVSRDADMDEIKKAYRKLSRKYHPDANINNPDKEQAEEMFKLVQQAYDQIVDEREHGTSGSYAGGGSGYGGFGGYGYQQTHTDDAMSQRLRAAVSYLNNQRYSEALNVLNDMTERTAEWYYYHAIANAGIGNNVNAQEDARQAAAMEPNNIQYQQLYRQLSGGAGWYQDMGRGYGYEECQPGGGNSAGLCTACTICAVLNLCCCNPYGGTVLCC